MQFQQDESGDEAGGRRTRRSSNNGVQYSEDLSDAMFNRLLQPDEHSDSASEVRHHDAHMLPTIRPL